MSDLFKLVYLVGLKIRPNDLKWCLIIENKRVLLTYLGMTTDTYLLQHFVREATNGP